MTLKALFSLATVLGLAVAARAQQGQPLPQAASDQQLRQVLAALETTKNALVNTNHDYGTHKNAGLKSIVDAQNHLLRALSQQPTAVLPRTTGQPGQRVEPKAVANARIGEAINTLNTSLKILQAANGNYQGHKNNALRELQEAINQLNQALRFSQRQPN
jgi:hypothetical protein